MNAAAFRRGEALTRLENYASVIVEHLALETWYPKNSALKHWAIELDAFKKALRRYNTGKGNKSNFTKALIVDTLSEVVDTNEDKDYLLIGVESHGVVLPDSPDWKALKKAIERFASDLTESV